MKPKTGEDIEKPERAAPEAAAPQGSLHRRSLLTGAAMFTGLGAWHALAGSAASSVLSAPLSVPGNSLADVRACEPIYEGGPGDCPPHGPGATTCNVATGGDVGCDDHTCAWTMTCTGTLVCNPATCASEMDGNCFRLHLCANQDGDCNNLTSCSTELTGDCLKLVNRSDMHGECNRLEACTKLFGTCIGMVKPCSDTHQAGGDCPGKCPENCGEHCGEEGSLAIVATDRFSGRVFEMMFSQTLSRG